MSFPSPRAVPDFAPVRVRGGRHRLRRAVRSKRRAMAAGLAVTAAALAAAGPRDTGRTPSQAAATAPERERTPVEAELVSAPVRIADAAAVRLLRPGDRVDVVAARDTGSRVLATGAKVAQVPTPREESGYEGALVVLSVPRATAVRLAGASPTSKLAVALC